MLSHLVPFLGSSNLSALRTAQGTEKFGFSLEPLRRRIFENGISKDMTSFRRPSLKGRHVSFQHDLPDVSAPFGHSLSLFLSLSEPDLGAVSCDRPQ